MSDEIEIITKYENGKDPKHYIMNGQDELVRIDLSKMPSPRKGDPSPVHIFQYKEKYMFSKPKGKDK